MPKASFRQFSTQVLKISPGGVLECSQGAECLCAHQVLQLVCSSWPASTHQGLFPGLLFYCLLISLQAERVPGALCSPFSRRFYNCCCCRTFFFPNNQSNAIQNSVLSLAPDMKMEPVPTHSALHYISDLNH